MRVNIDTLLRLTGGAESDDDYLDVISKALRERPELVDDQEVRDFIDDVIGAALDTGMSTDQIREALGNEVAALLAW